VRFAFIEQHAAIYPVRLMCRVLEVSASGYYAWRARPESARTIANRHLVAEIRRIEARHHGRYGSPRMHAALHAQGHRCSRGRVERLMRHHRIRALAGRRYRPCTPALHDGQPPLPGRRAEPAGAALRGLCAQSRLAGELWPNLGDAS
jgi:putative transposase